MRILRIGEFLHEQILQIHRTSVCVVQTILSENWRSRMNGTCLHVTPESAADPLTFFDSRTRTFPQTVELFRDV